MNAKESRTVAVIGGGISGLAAAWELTKRAPDVHVVLFEAGDRLGGKIRTERFAEGYVETGADSFVAREPWAVDLCEELGLAGELRPPEVFGAALWLDDRLQRLPPNLFYGIPTGTKALAEAPLGLTARLRALQDLVRPGALVGPDVSVGHLIRKRLGKEVLERLVDPLLSGTRAGRPDEMSVAAALPLVDEVARKNRSLMRGLGAQQSAGVLTKGPPPFLAPYKGMGRLAERLHEALLDRAEIHTGAPVDVVRPTGTGYELEGPGFRATHVIVTAPAFAAAKILQELSPDASRLLGAIDYAPSLSVALSFDRPLDVPANTSGALVPSSAGMTISAATWWSIKWPQAVQESFVVRCFVGGRTEDEGIMSASENEIVDACLKDVRTLTRSGARPTNALVTRWERGMPIYGVGHLELVRRIERTLEGSPGLFLAGSYLRGSGIPDCIRQARAAVDRILSG